MQLFSKCFCIIKLSCYLLNHLKCKEDNLFALYVSVVHLNMTVSTWNSDGPISPINLSQYSALSLLFRCHWKCYSWCFCVTVKHEWMNTIVWYSRLMFLFPVFLHSWTYSTCVCFLQINDWPSLTYRGIMFDISQGRVPNVVSWCS